MGIMLGVIMSAIKRRLMFRVVIFFHFSIAGSHIRGSSQEAALLKYLSFCSLSYGAAFVPPSYYYYYF